ncbi:hypothetical protein ACFU7Y_06985 [Kitasatospora sp. NPDC057542]|uniref:hypothetical protein n=1 Tax=Streptomycetaceae TaxID=2062 RepID=UPI0035A9849B
MWRFRVGSPWRDLPAEFGPRRSGYDRFRAGREQRGRSPSAAAGLRGLHWRRWNGRPRTTG